MEYESSKNLIGAARIFKKIRNKAFAATLQTMIRGSESLISYIADNIQFRNVTGNAYTSISVGVYYKGRLMHIASVGQHEKEPTRRTLAKGERYNSEYFYDEAHYADGSKKRHYFVGKYGQGGQWGPTLGPYYLKRQHPGTKDTWEMIVTIPVSYAGYVPGITRTFQNMMDKLPSCVRESIVRVETAPELNDGEDNG